MCFRVNKCCCFDLRTGCMIIGNADLVFQDISVILCLVNLSKGNIEPANGATSIAACVISIFAAAFLLLGVMSDKPGYLLFWIVLKGISLVIICITAISLIVELSAKEYGGNEMAAVVVLYLGINLIAYAIALNIYWWAVVKSYRAELILKLRADMDI